MRSVVVTGLGAVTPLGVGSFSSRTTKSTRSRLIGVSRSWSRLLNGDCGIRRLDSRGPAFQRLQCQVAGVVPVGPKSVGEWQAEEWLSKDVCLDCLHYEKSTKLIYR